MVFNWGNLSLFLRRKNFFFLLFASGEQFPDEGCFKSPFFDRQENQFPVAVVSGSSFNQTGVQGFQSGSHFTRINRKNARIISQTVAWRRMRKDHHNVWILGYFIVISSHWNCTQTWLFFSKKMFWFLFASGYLSFCCCWKTACI